VYSLSASRCLRLPPKRKKTRASTRAKRHECHLHGANTNPNAKPTGSSSSSATASSTRAVHDVAKGSHTAVGQRKSKWFRLSLITILTSLHTAHEPSPCSRVHPGNIARARQNRQSHNHIPSISTAKYSSCFRLSMTVTQYYDALQTGHNCLNTLKQTIYPSSTATYHMVQRPHSSPSLMVSALSPSPRAPYQTFHPLRHAHLPSHSPLTWSMSSVRKFRRSST
jgi:hypothetical protein